MEDVQRDQFDTDYVPGTPQESGMKLLATICHKKYFGKYSDWINRIVLLIHLGYSVFNNEDRVFSHKWFTMLGSRRELELGI